MWNREKKKNKTRENVYSSLGIFATALLLVKHWSSTRETSKKNKEKGHPNALKQRKKTTQPTPTTLPKQQRKKNHHHPNIKKNKTMSSLIRKTNTLRSVGASGTLTVWLVLPEVSRLCASPAWKQRWGTRKQIEHLYFTGQCFITLIERSDGASPLWHVRMQSCRFIFKNHFLETSKSLSGVSSQATRCRCFWCDSLSSACPCVINMLCCELQDNSDGTVIFCW